MSDALIHVVPADDLIPHSADMECCGAFINHDGLCIHNAYDRRECYERVGFIGLPGWKLQREEGVDLVDLVGPSEAELF